VGTTISKEMILLSARSRRYLKISNLIGPKPSNRLGPAIISRHPSGQLPNLPTSYPHRESLLFQ